MAFAGGLVLDFGVFCAGRVVVTNSALQSSRPVISMGKTAYFVTVNLVSLHNRRIEEESAQQKR